jgi:ADP-ribosylation factor-like protein 5B
MGFVMSKIWSMFASQGEVKVILIGLDNAGARCFSLIAVLSRLDCRRKDDHLVQTVSGTHRGASGRAPGGPTCRLFSVGSATFFPRLLNEVVVTAPTIGSNVEEVTYKNVKFVMWDLGGQESSRASWSTYYKQTNAMMLVVDSTDRERVPAIKAELDKMLASEQLRAAVLLVYANKQDVKGAMTAAEISDALGLHAIKDHGWHIQECCALTGFGLADGMDWLSRSLRKE